MLDFVFDYLGQNLMVVDVSVVILRVSAPVIKSNMIIGNDIVFTQPYKVSEYR